MGRLFGTDGVRGVANAGPLTPEQTCRLGRVAATYLAERAGPSRRRPVLLIARDTRVSGPLLEQALVAGILSAGVDALVAGVLPTPAIAFLIPALGAAGGAVLSASHNPFEDNGVKLFSGRGRQAAGRLGGRDRGAARGRPGRAAAHRRPDRARALGPGRRAPLSRRAPGEPAGGLRSDGRAARARLRSRRDVPRGAAPVSLARGGRGRRSERGRAGRTSTAAWGRFTRRRSRRVSARRPGRSASRSTATATVSSSSTSQGPSGTGTTCSRSAPRRSARAALSRAGSWSRR